MEIRSPCGHQHVHLALGRVGVDAQRLIDKVIGGVAHGGDHHGHLVALLFRLNNALATRLIDSVSATDEPPYFCTMRATAVLCSSLRGVCSIFYANATIIKVAAFTPRPAPTCGYGHGLRCSANIQVFTGGSLRQPHPSFEIRAVNYQLPANESKPARFPQNPITEYLLLPLSFSRPGPAARAFSFCVGNDASNARYEFTEQAWPTALPIPHRPGDKRQP